MTHKFLTAALAISAGLTLAPVAHADTDTQFVDTLTADGVYPRPGGRADLVADAHWVCNQIEQGYAPGGLAYWLNKWRQSGNTDSTIDDTFVRVAVQYYCPAHLKDLDSM
jgi:hypothetical protein